MMVDMNKLLTYNPALLMNPRHGSHRKFQYIIETPTHFQDYKVTHGMNWECLQKISSTRAVLQIYKVYQQYHLLKKVYLLVFSHSACVVIPTLGGGGGFPISDRLTNIILILKYKRRYLIQCVCRISGKNIHLVRPQSNDLKARSQKRLWEEAN